MRYEDFLTKKGYALDYSGHFASQGGTKWTVLEALENEIDALMERNQELETTVNNYRKATNSHS